MTIHIRRTTIGFYPGFAFRWRQPQEYWYRSLIGCVYVLQPRR